MRQWRSAEIVKARALGPQDLATSMTPEAALAEVRRALTASELVERAQAIGVADGRALRGEEIAALGAAGCTAQDWSLVRVASGFTPVRLRNVRFIGEVLLGPFEGEVEIAPGVIVPAGVYDSVLAHCAIGADSLILRVGLLANYTIAGEAVVRDCTTVVCEPGATFGCGLEIPVGPETGGREVLSYAELSVPVAECVAKRRGDVELLSGYQELVGRYLDRIRRDRGFIGLGAQVIGTGRLDTVFVGRGAVIEDAQTVRNSVIFSSDDEPSSIRDGSIVKDSVIQWGCAVDSGSIVEGSVLTEHSHVERHGKVTHSILGPNCAVGEGEITASLVGPFVSFHHQALLIATLWPEGRGNVAYGANVGSNHTSRAPDQELWPGEGIFFGLGCDVKFPSNFTRAPYSIIAASVRTLGQRVTMPFSLINPPAVSVDTISPSFNEIMPAWLLYANPYALWRNQDKFRRRNKARRSQFNLEIIRRDVVDLMELARQELRMASGEMVYMSKHVPGIGKNYMTEASRRRAIDGYTRYIRYWALLALMERLRAAEGSLPGSLDGLPAGDPDWERARQVLESEEGGLGVADWLRELVVIQGAIADDIRESREKDDTRGRLTIPGYSDAHPLAAEDPVVQGALEEARRVTDEVGRLLEGLD